MKTCEKNSFNNRYPLDITINYSDERIDEARNSYKKIALNNIEKVRKTTNRARNIEYFENILLNQDQRYQDLKLLKQQGKKVIGIFCIQVPEELIYAAGAIPIRFDCGFYESIAPAEEIIPKNTCPLIKSSVGFNFLKINNMFELCDAVIIPTTCDGKKKMAETLSNYANVWMLDLPNDKDNPAANEYFFKQIRELREKLEDLTNRQVTKNSLREAIQLLHKRTALARELNVIRRQEEVVINGRDSYLVMQTAFFDDINRWMNKLEVLIEELKQKTITKNLLTTDKLPRIHITGSAFIWPNMKVLHILEESGAIAISDDSCAGGQYFYNPVEVDEWSMKAMTEGISDKYLLPNVCPIFTHSDDRVDRIFELIEKGKADGVLYHLLRLCQPFDYEYLKVSKILSNKNTPLLRIETEYSEEDTGQIRTRIEAFLEMILARKEI